MNTGFRAAAASDRFTLGTNAEGLMLPRFIEHHGKKILYLDLACASPGEHNAGWVEAERVIGAEPERSVLLLVDLSFAGHNHETERLTARFDASGGRGSARARSSAPRG